MGTNYYLIMNACECCGVGERYHIGKSSAGWCFGLHIHRREPWYSDEDFVAEDFEAWEKHIRYAENRIENEYGDRISAADMLEIIADRGPWEGDLANHGGNPVYESRNLLRHRIDGRFCVGWGEGTYDYLVGEFS